MDAPARSARWEQELLHDAPMHTRSARGSEPGEMTQDVQHASAQVGIVQACTFNGERDGTSAMQGQEGGARGTGWYEDDSGGARVVENSPGAGRASPHSPPVELADASQTSSQAREETILRAGQGVGQEMRRGGHGFRRLQFAAGGVLRTAREAADATVLRTAREAADAAVRRAKRFFFRDEG